MKNKKEELTAYDRFRRIFGANATEKFSAPGRVNIIGEHIDYCGGKVLPAALTQRCDVYARLNGTNEIRFTATTTDHRNTVLVDKLNDYRHIVFGLYQTGVAYFCQQAGVNIQGMDILYDCKVPFGSGLSSSAAIEVSMAAACYYYDGRELDRKAIALIGQRAEREYCNVNCGIMDQYASAFGKAGNAMLLDCSVVEHEYVPLLLGDYTLVLTDCKKPHSLVTSKYNERFAEAQAAADILSAHMPNFKWTDVDPAALDSLKGELGDVLYRRARHIVTECKRVEDAVAAMRAGDLETLGSLLNASHMSMKDDYEVTGDELDILSEAGRKQRGCLGSRMTGGGFGGCTVSLVKRSEADAFKAAVEAEYTAATGYKPAFYETEAGDGVKAEKL